METRFSLSKSMTRPSISFRETGPIWSAAKLMLLSAQRKRCRSSTKGSAEARILEWHGSRWASTTLLSRSMMSLSLLLKLSGTTVSSALCQLFPKTFLIMKKSWNTATAGFKFQNCWVSSCELVSTFSPSGKKNAGLLTLVLLTPDTSLELNAISQCLSYRPRCKDGCDYKCLLASMQALARQSKFFGFISVVLNLYRLQILRSTDSPKLLCLAALRSILTVSDWLHSLSAPVPVTKHICLRCKAGSLPFVESSKRSWPRKMKKLRASVRSLSHANSKSDRYAILTNLTIKELTNYIARHN